MKVGGALSISGSTLDTSAFSLCGSFVGPSTDGAVEDIVCQSKVSGTAVAVVKTVTTYVLTLCEVQIYPVVGVYK